MGIDAGDQEHCRLAREFHQSPFLRLPSTSTEKFLRASSLKALVGREAVSARAGGAVQVLVPNAENGKAASFYFHC